MIIDESDEYIFNDPLAFMKLTKKIKCIALTTTCSDDQLGGIERQVLSKMDFKIFEGFHSGDS